MLSTIIRHIHVYILTIGFIFLLYTLVAGVKKKKTRNKRYSWCFVSSCILLFETFRLLLDVNGVISTPRWYLLVCVAEWVPVCYTWTEWFRSASKIIRQRI